jgi:hypothetical protein
LTNFSLISVALLHTAQLQLRPSNPSALVAGSSPREPGSLLAVKQMRCRYAPHRSLQLRPSKFFCACDGQLAAQAGLAAGSETNALSLRSAPLTATAAQQILLRL